MMQILIDVIATLAGVGATLFLILLTINIVLFFKLRSMFDYHVRLSVVDTSLPPRSRSSCPASSSRDRPDRANPARLRRRTTSPPGNQASPASRPLPAHRVPSAPTLANNLKARPLGWARRRIKRNPRLIRAAGRICRHYGSIG